VGRLTPTHTEPPTAARVLLTTRPGGGRRAAVAAIFPAPSGLRQTPTMTDTSTDTRHDGNWGRWGADDERGTLNLLTPERVLAATQVCKTGKVYSLSLPIQNKGVPLLEHRPAPQRLSLTSASDIEPYVSMGGAPGLGANEDVLVVASHNTTHMDALSHVYTEDGIYNGFPRDEFSTKGGAGHCDIRATATFAGRGILLDLPGHQGVDWLEPGHAITRAELDECAAAQGTEVRAGDILLVRTGWLDLFEQGTSDFAQPGLGVDTVSFVDDHDIAAVGVDNSAVECIPFDDNVFLVVHIELLVKRGVTLMEHLKLSELAADRCHEFFLSVGALPVTGAAGSPINPVAIG
jgi:kynurenine formamidase